jgi:ankyrin repeat protein
MLACTRNNLEIIKFLVEHKADLGQRNKDGWTAFQIAIRCALFFSYKN